MMTQSFSRRVIPATSMRLAQKGQEAIRLAEGRQSTISGGSIGICNSGITGGRCACGRSISGTPTRLSFQCSLSKPLTFGLPFLFCVLTEVFEALAIFDITEIRMRHVSYLSG